MKDHAADLERKKREKTAFLVDSMIAGYPIALIISTYFTNDEHGVKRVPMLLHLLSLALTDVTNNPNTKKRKFRVDLEYGIGDNLLKWSLEKTAREFSNLNSKLRLQFLQENVLLKGNKEPDLPKFPKYNAPGSGRTKSIYASGMYSRRSSISENSTLSSSPSNRNFNFLKFKNRNKIIFTNTHYRNAMQEYLDTLCQTLTLKAQANRIFQFFELSPIGVLLTNENGKKRKEGYLLIKTTAKAQGWRVGHLRVKDLKAMVERHTAKWFLIGHSYIMYVADINSTTPLDVFLVDSSFKFTLSGLGDNPITHQNITEFSKQQQKIEDIEDDDDDFDDDISPGSGKSYLSLTFENSERKLSVVGKSATILRKWCLSVNEMMNETRWSKPNRFESFAPVRDDCFAQWFVDSRDYMWAASSALEMAKDCIYIHDWWLSPELYMRRPANGNQEWRLDRILKRKAEQGVKIFVIVYRNVGNTVVTDSMWTKHSLLDLHENVYVLRSPNQLMQNVYFWAHHEKMMVIDHTICFIGGVDLCYGRFDTPDHVLTDDAPFAFESQIPRDSKADIGAMNYQMFPGKDYSNPRARDFSDLNSPFEDMFDRQVTPRMPWHDVHMMSSGQIARDLSRHFVQRWNYLLRQKRPSRPTPLLLPPKDFTNEELSHLGLTGTCEVQVLRSSSSWSLGIKEDETSIQNAYLKAIESSEHFIHIENQFFVTAHVYNGVAVKNRIGDALVERIIRAHRSGTVWKAVIIIPLMPGFESQVDSKEGSSVRVIMQCQYMSISMGESSIYAKLRKVGIRPEDYIQFYSLRKWGYIGKSKTLVTEQLYIHAKTMIVDDRIAIIGSANINERSMRGNRDSELCVIVRDKQMIQTHMDGRPYQAGKFAHTLRMRLMREHLGVDVDLLDMVERRLAQIEKFASTTEGLQASTLKVSGDIQDDELSENPVLSAMVELGARYVLNEPEGTKVFRSILSKPQHTRSDLTKVMIDSFKSGDLKDSNEDELDDIPYIYSFNHRAGKENSGIRDKKSLSTDSRVTDPVHRSEVKGHGADKYHSEYYSNSKVKVTKILQNWAASTFSATEDADSQLPFYDDIVEFLSSDDDSMTVNDLNKEKWDVLKRLLYMHKLVNKNKLEFAHASNAVPSASHDINVSSGTENAITPENTEIKRPTVPSMSLGDTEIEEIDKNALPQTVSNWIDPYSFEDPLEIDFFEGTWMPQSLRNTLIFQMVFHTQPDDSVHTWKDYKNFQELQESFMLHQKLSRGDGLHTKTNLRTGVDPNPDEVGGDDSNLENGDYSTGDLLEEYNGTGQLDTDIDHLNDDATSVNTSTDVLRNALRKSKVAQMERYQRPGSSMPGAKVPATLGLGGVYDYETAEKLLKLVRGNLVQFPTRWLKKEVEGSNWFYAADKLPPIQIYN
ncbi:hypothetical protein CANARDRAFT_177654 [[Candida] arabinofermentans NRRL YB-2248]|uniref:Phospholipase n=1 Tax=[Candida] arabinofermentans NRRL YB-2248 TaxID=983967 RepID=A0A1E4SVI4_9ASCO|nr:hypothetical protein CANARDRAFT_177654 [[Candida] arabinofermentans NRRL YB-2248]